MFMLLHLKLSKQLWHYNHGDVIKSCSTPAFYFVRTIKCDNRWPKRSWL